MVFLESDDGSGITIAVTESDGSLEIILVLNKPVGVDVITCRKCTIATAITATGLLNVFGTYINNHLLVTWYRDFGPSQTESCPVTFTAGSVRQSVNTPITGDSVMSLRKPFN